MILVESMLASIPYRLPICSRLKSLTAHVLHTMLLVRFPCMTVTQHHSPTPTQGCCSPAAMSSQTLERKTGIHTHTCCRINTREIAAKTMINETDLEVIEHVYSDGGAFKLGCACKCFPLIGSQKRFITRGEYRSATRVTENKFNSDLMSCRVEI